MLFQRLIHGILCSMKYLLLLALTVLCLLMHFELDISLKESGLLARFSQPAYSKQNLVFLAAMEHEDNNSIKITTVAQNYVPVAKTLVDDSILHEDIVARVIDVIDGDTIEVMLSGEIQRVRYIGVNTPELGEPCYREATAANRKLVKDKVVTLYSDETDTDRYGRLLRYVFVGDVLVERELVARGFAEAVRYRSDDDYYEEFTALEQSAAAAGSGCHPSGIFADDSAVR